jgi:tRNA (adenine57-N1/adenine58-N1)-methyltransferase
MIAHTAFLVSARRLAPGVVAPPRRRKPSKGAEAYALRRAATQTPADAADEAPSLPQVAGEAPSLPRVAGEAPNLPQVAGEAPPNLPQDAT